MSFHGRETVSIENEYLRVSVLREGGHVAELFHKQLGLSPLWVPPWRTAEPSTYRPDLHPEYGLDSESKLLTGIMGHNLCLDIFGPPSQEEAAAGLTVHGESSVVRYEVEQGAASLKMSAQLPLSGLTFQRELTLQGESLLFDEIVLNTTALDKPVAWTQHVTLGPPFLHMGTQFSMPAVRSRTMEETSPAADHLASATEFTWPHLPTNDGATVDLSVFDEEPFSRFSTHLMRAGEQAGFAAFSPQHRMLMGYEWRRADFPWVGMWQENKMRSLPPWNNRTVTCGMEFGVSPYPETRREMISRPPLFETPVYRWLPAQGSLKVSYRAFVHPATELEQDSWRH